MDPITLKVKMFSVHLGIERNFSRKKKMLRGSLPFFDLETQTFLKIGIWSFRIDNVWVMTESSCRLRVNVGHSY